MFVDEQQRRQRRASKAQPPRGVGYSGGGFGAEHPLEARPDELDADNLFAVGEQWANVHDAPLCFEVDIVAPGGPTLQRNADLQA